MDLKPFARPLQAFAALGLCLGMAWMTFVVAGFNPSPPTVHDIHARSTQDQSYTSMNNTAVALAANFLGEMVPSPIVLPVTGNEVSSPTTVVVVTLRAVSTVQTTATPFSIFGFLIEPTFTREPRRDDPTSTSSPVPSPTPRPPTATKTAILSRTPVPSNTPEPTATNTFPPPTDTGEPPTEHPVPTETIAPPSEVPTQENPASTPESVIDTPGSPE